MEEENKTENNSETERDTESILFKSCWLFIFMSIMSVMTEMTQAKTRCPLRLVSDFLLLFLVLFCPHD